MFIRPVISSAVRATPVHLLHTRPAGTSRKVERLSGNNNWRWQDTATALFYGTVYTVSVVQIVRDIRIEKRAKTPSDPRPFSDLVQKFLKTPRL